MPALLAPACGSGGGVGDARKPSNGAKGGSGFPVKVKVKDCAGVESTFTAAPKKIVTSNASSLEMLMWLGAGDRVIGTGFPPGKGTMPARFAAQAAKVPALSRGVIPKEKLLGSGADL